MSREAPFPHKALGTCCPACCFWSSCGFLPFRVLLLQFIQMFSEEPILVSSVNNLQASQGRESCRLNAVSDHSLCAHATQCGRAQRHRSSGIRHLLRQLTKNQQGKQRCSLPQASLWGRPHSIKDFPGPQLTVLLADVSTDHPGVLPLGIPSIHPKQASVPVIAKVGSPRVAPELGWWPKHKEQQGPQRLGGGQGCGQREGTHRQSPG